MKKIVYLTYHTEISTTLFRKIDIHIWECQWEYLALLVAIPLRRWLLDLLVPGSFPDQFYRVEREVIKNKVDFFFLFFYTWKALVSKQSGGR